MRVDTHKQESAKFILVLFFRKEKEWWCRGQGLD